MGYGSQKAPRRLSLAPGIPAGLALGELGWHWETRGQVRLWVSPPRLVPQGSGKPPHHLPVPEPHPSTGWGGRNLGLALEVPAARWVEGPSTGPPNSWEQRERQEQASSQAASLPGTPKLPLPGGHSPSQAARGERRQPPTVPKRCSRGKRYRPTGPTPKGAGRAQCLGLGRNRRWGQRSPRPVAMGLYPLAATLPSCLTQYHPQCRTVGSGWGCPPTAVGQQIPEPALTSKIVQPHTAKAGGLPLGSPHPPPPRWARGGDGTSPLFPSPHSRTRSIILPRSPLEMQARTEVLTPSISAPRLTSLAAPSPCAGGLGGHVCADASSGKTRW